MDRKSTSGEEWLRRAKSEFVEMPGLRLTEPQARRLWGLDQASCSRLLDTLVETRFLCRTRGGMFLRVGTNGAMHSAALQRSVGRRR